MNTPEELKRKTQELVSKFKQGEICQDEVIFKFNLILKDLTIIIGEDNELLNTLRKSFNERVNNLQKFRSILNESDDVNEEVFSLKLRYNLI